MAIFVRLSLRERELEEQADALLAAAPRDPERPVYTEIQMQRRGRRLVSIRELAETAQAVPQEMEDELRFLIAISPMNIELKRCLRLWIDGWTQEEIARGFGVSQQLISKRLRKALRICYDSTPLAFRRFSHHTIYRRPRPGPDHTILRRCLHCDDEYPLGNGAGRYCSEKCRETARHQRKRG